MGRDANAIEVLGEGGCGHVGRRSPCVAVFACREAYDGTETDSRAGVGDAVTPGGGRQIALVGLPPNERRYSSAEYPWPEFVASSSPDP